MRDRSVGMVLVFEPSPGQLRGVITDRDLATRVCADDKRAAQTLVSDVASLEVVTCRADDELRDAEEKMQKTQKSRLVVLGENGEVVGVVSLADIFRYESHRRAVRTARAVLAREARGRSTSPERINLTPSTPEDEAAALRQGSVMVGGTRPDTMKVFPT